MKRRKSPLKGYQKVRDSHLSFIRILLCRVLLCRSFTQGVSEGKGWSFSCSCVILRTSLKGKGGHILGPLLEGCQKISVIRK